MTAPKLAASQAEVLRTQVIDATQPGPVLHDFHVVLDYVGPAGVKAGGKYNLLPIEAIGELDERLSRPLRLSLKRPQLRSHPYLQGLHLLLRASGLGLVEGSGDKGRLAVDPALLARWQGLNATEQYFNLLEAWLRLGRPEMVGEQAKPWGGLLADCLTLWHGLARGGRRFDPDRPREVYLFGIGRDRYQLALMDLFGLVYVEQPPQPVQPWSPPAVARVPFGDAVFTLLEPRMLERADESESDRFGAWQPLFQPYFPDWRNNLVLPPAELPDGVFVFRVSLGKAHRTIAMPAEATLDELASWILNSVDFDSDHLYEFIYRDRFGAQVRVSHPYCEEPPFTDEVRVGELPLRPGQAMTFHFDFGDDWRFDVKLERVEPSGNKKPKPRLLAKEGKAPEQYPNWEE
jgi:hypothetical protein